MHYENRLFWQWLRATYPQYFAWEIKAIEFGSMNINGSVRNIFVTQDYVGVDWIEGKDVDLVSLAHEVPFPPETFDTVVSASMLEHDPYWEKSLAKMAEVMKKTGLFAVSWGSALNTPHCLEVAPDGGFHPLRAGLVLRHLESLGLYVHTFKYERTVLLECGNREIAEARTKNELYGKGTAVLVAFKDAALAVGDRHIDPLIKEDEA